MDGWRRVDILSLLLLLYAKKQQSQSSKYYEAEPIHFSYVFSWFLFSCLPEDWARDSHRHRETAPSGLLFLALFSQLLDPNGYARTLSHTHILSLIRASALLFASTLIHARASRAEVESPTLSMNLCAFQFPECSGECCVEASKGSTLTGVIETKSSPLAPPLLLLLQRHEKEAGTTDQSAAVH